MGRTIPMPILIKSRLWLNDMLRCSWLFRTGSKHKHKFSQLFYVFNVGYITYLKEGVLRRKGQTGLVGG